MLEFPLIDTHVHLWDPANLNYPWLSSIPLLNRPFLLSEYNRATGPIEVEGMVFVECDVAPELGLNEMHWVLDLARGEKRIRGIVSYAPIERGAAVREYLKELAREPLVKGVRKLLYPEEDDFCLRPKTLEAVQALEEFGLSFDICVDKRQLPQAVEMVRRCSGVHFILDHIANPDIRAGLLDPWRSDLRAMAALPNVVCKMSGLVVKADWQAWTREDLRPYIDHVIDCFGFDRVMYGGDWPVAIQATEYPRWVETLDWAVADCSASERSRLFRDNARRYYHLEGIDIKAGGEGN